MNIAVPKNIKSPTVIIVGGSQPDEKMNEMHSKQMSMLERKLDDQYKAFMDNKDYIKLIETLHKSFMSKLDKIISVNKSLMNDTQNKRIDDLKVEINNRIKGLSNNGTDKMIKSFSTQLLSLENTIKSIPTNKPIVKVVRNNGGLDKSFLEAIGRLEKTIWASRPRVFPSPS